MNKQELQNKIEDLEKQLAEVKEQVNSIEFEGIKKGVRQMPKVGEKYFFLNDSGFICEAVWIGSNPDLFHFNTGNCFKTEQEAEEYKENLLTKQALKDLALELNKGVEIDWSDCEQYKYIISYSHNTRELLTDYNQLMRRLSVYCLNDNFIGIAKDRIGEEKLIKLIKSGV